MRLIAVSSGTYYHIETLEGDRAPRVWDLVTTPEDLAPVLLPSDTVFVPCRSPAQRLIPQAAVFAEHLDNGGTIVAMGESLCERWLPGVKATRQPTNWWWWLEKGADLGVHITQPEHPLLSSMKQADVTWHLHGFFHLPEGAQTLIADRDGRAIMVEDRVTTPGRMIMTTLDPCYHHGSHFMPATTDFLGHFLPALRAFARGDRAWTASTFVKTAAQ